MTTAVQFPIQWQTTFGPASFYSWAARDVAKTWLTLHTYKNPRDEEAWRGLYCVEDDVPIKDSLIAKFRKICDEAVSECSWSQRQVAMLGSAADRYAMLMQGATQEAQTFQRAVEAFTYRDDRWITGLDVDGLEGIVPSFPEGVPEIYDLAYRIYTAYRKNMSDERILRLFGDIVDRFAAGAEQVYCFGNVIVNDVGTRYRYETVGEHVVFERKLDLDGSPVGTVGDFEPLDRDESRVTESLELVNDAMPYVEAFKILLGKYEVGGRPNNSQIIPLEGKLEGHIRQSIGHYSYLNLPALMALRSLVAVSGAMSGDMEQMFLKEAVETLEKMKGSTWLTPQDRFLEPFQALPEGTWLTENDRAEIDEALAELKPLIT